MSFIEILDRIKKKNVDALKIKNVLEEYERFTIFSNDYVSKYDIAVLVLFYHFPQKDELHEDVDALIGFYIETTERMSMEDKRRFIDLIYDYLDHK
jgi:hypothetical protein